MAELHPIPFSRLVARMFRELETKNAIFDLPRRKFFLGSPDHDLGVRFHGRRASSPLGPAAGPQSQLAQNLVLSWLGGSRIFELKTVQIRDRLEIPRPCIDMRTVGYNVEWSQELRLEQSLEEYVKASMLVELLTSSGALPLVPGFDDVIYDMSVGYDLEGIRSGRVLAFIRGMRQASETIDRLRNEIPPGFERYRDLPFRSRVSDSVTLSTFHGCPPDEIEKIIDFLLRDLGLDCVIKLNPTLLGPDEVRRLLDLMGYDHVRVPASAFAKDTKWEQAVGFIERLSRTAQDLGLGLGVKFTNTLIVENHGDFLPASEKEMYLSGPPLHLLAMNLVARLREHFGTRIPISFSAGIDRSNFSDAVALGLTPITVCTDLLKPEGYGRQSKYFRELLVRMDAVGARSIDEFIVGTRERTEAGVRSGGRDGGRDGARERERDEALLENTRSYVGDLATDSRYAWSSHAKPPKKVGTTLVLFDCLTCDKCIPVCPNDANFALVLPPREIPIQKLRQVGGGWELETGERLVLTKKHQIGNFADLCNECGNCDVFCPEDGGPYVLKPRFFGTMAEWERYPELDGFYLRIENARHAGHAGPAGPNAEVHGRIDGRGFRLRVENRAAWFSGDGFELRLDRDEPARDPVGHADSAVDLTYYHILELILEAFVASGDVNFVSV